MIKNEKILVKISNKTLPYYKKINSYAKIGDTIEITSLELQNGSNIEITGICDYCGEEKKISKKSYNLQTDKGGKKFTCSKKCSLLKSREKNLEKWGVENPFQSEKIKEKIKNSIIKRYGVENPQKSNEVKEKSKITSLNKYGFKKPSMSELVKEKVRNTNNYKFGVNYPAQSDIIKEKAKQTCNNRYGVDNFSKTETFKTKLKNNSFNRMLDKLKKHGELLKSDKGSYVIECGMCSNRFVILHTLMYKRIIGGEIICTECNPKSQAIKENELYNFIRENYNGKVIKNYRNLISKELDIYLPDLNLAFEFNGLYWHSELYKSRNYHIDKTKECNDNGVQLIHIWEDDWILRKDIVKSIILNKMKKSKSIYARKTEIKEITDNKIIRDFLNKNHIQGFVGSSIKLGLYYKGDLVALMTFGKLRRSLGQKSEEGYYELIRYCSNLNTNVIGGASKTLKYFIDSYQPKSIISYSDNSISDGYMYDKIGFKLLSETVVNYYWVINGVRNHRFNFRKDKLVKSGYDSNKTEIEIMNELGYYRIFDCGSKKWLYNKI
jgi:hypothetical protein